MRLAAVQGERTPLETVRSREEMEAELGICAEWCGEGQSDWPGMSYEQGVEAAIKWLIGETDVRPTRPE